MKLRRLVARWFPAMFEDRRQGRAEVAEIVHESRVLNERGSRLARKVHRTLRQNALERAFVNGDRHASR